VAEQLPSGLLEEFLAVTDPRKLTESSTRLGKLLQRARRSSSRLRPLEKLRERPIPLKTGRAPWEQGYDLARGLRDRLGVNGAHVQTVEQLGKLLSQRTSARPNTSSDTRSRIMASLGSTTRGLIHTTDPLSWKSAK